MNKQTIQIEFKLTSILMVLAMLAGLWLVFLLREIILYVFIAFILASALEPLLRKLYLRFRVPQVISLASAFLVVIGLIALGGFLVIPVFAHQIDFFLHNLPNLMGRAISVITGSTADQAQIQQYTQGLTAFLGGRIDSLSGSVFQVGVGVFTAFISAVTIVVISFYMIVEKESLYQGLALLLPRHDYARIRQVLDKVQHKLGLWLRGQLLLGAIIGVGTWVGLSLLGLQEYALPLAILAGILELIPIVGPLLSALPAVLIALTINPTLAIFVVLLYLLIQQLEAHLVVPKVMERAVGLNPLFVIIALISGGALMGILGALIAVPVAVVIATILEDVREHEHHQAKD